MTSNFAFKTHLRSFLHINAIQGLEKLQSQKFSLQGPSNLSMICANATICYVDLAFIFSTLQFISFAQRPFFGKAEIENSIKIVHLIGHSKLSNLFQEYDFPSMDKLSTNRIIHSCHPNYEKKRNVHKHWKGTQSTVGKTLVQMVNRSIVKRKNGEVPSFILRPLRAKGRHCFYSCCCFQTNRNTTTTKSSWP